MSGLDSPFLWFNDVSSNGVLEYKYVDGERILARLVGDTLIWSDRSVYRGLRPRVFLWFDGYVMTPYRG